jgi:hypothetical protein
VVHRVSSASRGPALFPLDIPILNRPLKVRFIHWGFVILEVLKHRFKRRSSMAGTPNVVLNDIVNDL